ncbi:MAG: BON domain-containing protein [Acidobacteriota bacterium]
MKRQRFPEAQGLAGLAIILLLAGGLLPAAGQDKNPDAAVLAKIEGKFKQHGLLVGNDIRAAVADKTVTLTGTVRTLAQREDAERDAKSAAKKYKVVNDLVLAAVERSPREIGDAVMAGIEQSRLYAIYDYVGLGVTEKGEVTLKGWVYYPWHAAEFVKIAKSQPGVVKVEDETTALQITGLDETLRYRIARLFYTRPMVLPFSRMTGPVHVVVFNAVVTLGGWVERESDIAGYEQIVRANVGGLNIINMLRARKK